MRILLISANKEKSPYLVAPLGLAYLSGILIKEGHDVRVLDLCFIEDVEKYLNASIEEFSPELIGISIRNIDNLTYPLSISYLPFIKSVTDHIKAITDVPIVLGGSGFSIFPEEILDYLGLDIGVIGEGEKAIKGLAEGKHTEAIPNLIFRKDGRFFRSLMEPIEDFGRPFRGGIDNEGYLKWGGMGNIQTKRGCPFNCIYCTYPLIDGRKMRLRSPEQIGEEIEFMFEEYGIDHIFFVDDIFNYPVEHAESICREIIKRRPDVRWTAFCNPAFISSSLFSLMKDAGCQGIEFGTDSLSESVLKNLRKSFSPEDVVNACDRARKAGLETAHYIIFGGPGETPETIKETFKRLDRLNPTAVIAMIGIRVYPGTPIEAMSREGGFLKKGAVVENGQINGLEPVFYLSSEEETLIELVREQAISRPNWVVPGLDIRSGGEDFIKLRRMGKRGPLWDLLGR
jgi:radical SAM superfamily enzyme YgiQ (UPF0313 family)